MNDYTSCIQIGPTTKVEKILVTHDAGGHILEYPVEYITIEQIDRGEADKVCMPMNQLLTALGGIERPKKTRIHPYTK